MEDAIAMGDCDECDNDREVTCPACNGNASHEVYAATYYEPAESIDCSSCDGTGKVPCTCTGAELPKVDEDVAAMSATQRARHIRRVLRNAHR